MLIPVHRTGLVSDEVFLRHVVPLYHPEQPDRLNAVMRQLQSMKALLHKVPILRATEDQITACHDHAYFQLVQNEVAAGLSQLSTGDTDVCFDSFEVALFAAGGVCAMVDAVMLGEVDNGFCLVRPPGHHATRSQGMGFCLFNNIAVGARYAQQQYGCERIVIVDWDVHHGNGTQDIFYEDPSVLFFSTHQHPFYPGTGSANERGHGPGEGYTINCPLPTGTEGLDVLKVFREELLPAVKKYKPDLVMISAGFDSRIDDPLGDWLLTDRDFKELTMLLLDCASYSANGRIVSVLEGGYNLEGLGLACAAHIDTLVTG